MNRYKLFGILLTGLLMSSCSDDYNSDGSLQPALTAYYLSVSETTFDYYFYSKEITESFSIESFSTPWEFTNTPDWVSLSPSSGSSSANISMTISENTSADNARTAIFYLTSKVSEWPYNKAMSVSQGKATPTISLDTSSLTISGATGTYEVAVSANCTWTAKSNESWLSASNVGGNLYMIAEANPTKSYRSATITLSYGSKSATFRVTQSPSNVTTSIYTLRYDNSASKYDIQIESEADWTAESSASWISVSPNEGKAGKNTVSIEVTPNTSISSRTGNVIFYTGSYSKLEIKIEQKGIYIDADESLNFTSAAETKSLYISSNTSWSVISAPNWLSLSHTSGSGDSTISVTSTENPNTSSRSGEIVLGQAGLDVNCTIYVNQAGKFFSSDQTIIEFSDKAGSSTFNVESDASWTSLTSSDWFTSSPNSGRGNAEIVVSVSENKSVDERTGTIEYSFANSTSNVIVHQLSKYLTIDSQTFEFESVGGSHTIDLSTNDKWDVSIENNVDWLSVSKSSGEGDASLILTASDNPSVNTRSTTVVITTEYSQAIRILVSQKPRTLSLSTQSLLFFSAGGYSETVTVNTDGTYEITSGDSWYTITRGKDNTFTVYATKNNTNDIRKGTITVKLTDLKEGALSIDLPVTQAGEGGTFIINGYQSDNDWDSVTSGSITLTIRSYTTDQNWDSSNSNSLKVNLTGYSTDNDWNIDDRANGRVTINPYGIDVNWDQDVSNTGSISSGQYGSDSNWNNGSYSSGSFNNGQYGSDSNWNNGSYSSGSFNNGQYGSDSNWNNGSSNSGSFNNGQYGSDSNWNNSSSNSGSFNNSQYGSENNWNNQ